MKDSLLPLTLSSSAEKYKIKYLNYKVYKADKFIKLTYCIIIITIVNIMETFFKDYRIWPAEILPCIDRKYSLLFFEVLINKAKIDKAVSKLSSTKEI